MRTLAPIVLLSCLLACRATDVPVATAGSAPTDTASAGASSAAQDPSPAGGGSDAAEKKAEALKQKRKELRDKRRELDHAQAEHETAELDRRVRTLDVEARLQRSAAELDAARRALELFLGDTRARELDQRRISLDATVYAAEHSKEELAELVAMYDADEFAKSTKELVIRRARRALELAERRVGVERRELAELEQHTLPERERELRRKVADAELERTKGAIDADKARLEQEIAARKARERLADLAEQIAELEAAIAKESK